MDASAYKTLIEVTRRYNESLKAINIQMINAMQNEDVIKTVKGLSVATGRIAPDINNAALGIAEILKNAARPEISITLQGIAAQYKNLFQSYDFSPMSEAMRSALEKSQFTSIAQLCLSYETPMIHDAISCFANAQYEYLPGVINQAMQGSTMGAADIAFLKTGRIIPIIESELEYPRGLKSSLRTLNKATAKDISDNEKIEYATKSNQFVSKNSKIDSKGMNIVCAGIEMFDDLFSEVELMDFASFLSRTPSMGGFNETGRKIYQWIMEMYSKKVNIMSFDHDIYFHCRSRREDEIPYTFDEMRKAPYGISGPGRFNPAGRSHFYFADTKVGAETEVKKHLKKDEVLQTVKIKPKKEIVLLDLSGKLQRGAAFLKMIRYPLKDNSNNQMPTEYLLPGYVAECCKLIGIEGIKFYGSKDYVNYVSWDDGYFDDAGMCE